jgi:hypothetical protein
MVTVSSRWALRAPAAQPSPSCWMLGSNGTENPLKHIERDDSMIVSRLRGERVRRCGCGDAHGFTFA